MMSLGAQTAFHLAEAGEPGGSLFLDEIKEEWKSVFAKLFEKQYFGPVTPRHTTRACFHA